MTESRECDEVVRTEVSKKTHGKKNADKSVEDEVELDEVVCMLKERMYDAAAKDTELYKKKLPAINKYTLLPMVVQMLTKASMNDYILENNLLDAVRVWLTPYEDGVLPGLDIRKKLLESLLLLKIDRHWLKESGIGKTVMYLYKCPAETRENKKIAQKLIYRWCRIVERERISNQDD